VFASLGWPDEAHAMVKLAPQEQTALVRRDGATFRPAPGAWGRNGSTLVTLAPANPDVVADALRAAWRFIAGKPPARPKRPSRSPKTI
jgi:hypothetical protein